MKRDEPSPDQLEHDPLWSLLGRSPAPQASGRFVDDVMRALRLAAETPLPWWRRFRSPFAWGGLTTAAAGVVLALLLGQPHHGVPGKQAVASTESLADLQTAAEEEMLVSAADHLSEYSDAELVALLGL